MKKTFRLTIALILLLAMLIPGAAFASEYPEMEITVNGNQMVLNSDYPSSDIPEGFYETYMEYEGVGFYGGMDIDTDTIQLFFIRSDTDPSLTGFYQLMSDGSFKKYEDVSVGVGGSRFVTTTLPEGVAIPDGYVETTTVLDNKSITAYVQQGITGDEVGIYLLYGSYEGGSNGWYSYDQREGTIQRFFGAEDKATIQAQAEKITNYENQLKELNDKYNSDVGRSKNLFILSFIACVLFFFLMLNAIIRRRHERMDLEDRITDLRRHGGKETQNFSKSEKRRNARMDAEAEERADRIEDKRLYREEEKAAKASRKKSKKRDTGFLDDDEPDEVPVRKRRVSKETMTEIGVGSDSESKKRKKKRTDEFFAEDIDRQIEEEERHRRAAKKVKEVERQTEGFDFVDLDDFGASKSKTPAAPAGFSLEDEVQKGLEEALGRDAGFPAKSFDDDMDIIDLD